MNETKKDEPRNTLSWVNMAWVACGCFLLGKAVALLPLNPLYLSLVRPLAGIGLSLFLFHGLRIWPGVLIGIAAVHLLPVGGRDPWTIRLGFILGETLQYFAGYFMVRRVIGPPPVYDEEKSFFKFALLAPLMGLVNPSVQWGINLFFGAGRNFLWLYSWMGESFGILIFTPIVCLWHREGLKNWRGRSLVATLPVAGSFIIALGFFVYANNIENARFRQDFIQATKSLAENIEGRLNELEDHLSFVERFYAGSDFVSRDEFRVFLSAFLLDHPEVMIQWAPRIEQKERAKFETDARKRGGPVFNISERATDLGLVREGERHSLEVLLSSRQKTSAHRVWHFFLITSPRQNPIRSQRMGFPVFA